MPPGVCDICGKQLRTADPEAMRSHQRESQSCMPVVGKNESARVKALDARLREVLRSAVVCVLWESLGFSPAAAASCVPCR